MTLERDKNTFRIFKKDPSSPVLVFQAHAFTVIEDDKRKLITAGHVMSNISKINSIIFISNDNQEWITNPKFSSRRKWGDVVEANIEGEGGFEIAKKVKNKSEIFIYSPSYFRDNLRMKLTRLGKKRIIYENLDHGKFTIEGCSGSPILDINEELIGVHTNGKIKPNKYKGYGWRINK